MKKTYSQEDLKLSGKAYASVHDLMAGQGTSDEVKKKVAALVNKTVIVQTLTVMRHKLGVTQKQLAEKMGCKQGTISKLESGLDDELKVGEIRAYVSALGGHLQIGLGKRLTPAQAIHGHVDGLNSNLKQLADLAHKDDQIEKEIFKFMEGVFSKVMKLIVECENEMPKSSNPTLEDVEVQVVNRLSSRGLTVTS